MPPVPDANVGAGEGAGWAHMGAGDDLLLCVNDAVNDVSASESSVSF